MIQARACLNQKLYYSAVLLKALQAALEDAEVPGQVLLQAYGQAIQGHLQDAYGYLLLELSGTAVPFPVLPANLSELVESVPGLDPLRGELQELRQMEGTGNSWLARLLEQPHHTVVEDAAPSQVLAASSGEGWTLQSLQACHDLLAETADRLGDSLHEW